MGRFTRILRGLQDVFPPSGRENVGVSELSETVSPVFEFPGRQGSLDRVRTFSVNSTSVVTPANTFGFTNDGVVLASGTGTAFDVGGQEVYSEILYADLSHDSATSRAIQLFIQTPGAPAINTAIGRWDNFASARTVGVPSGFNPVFSEAVVETIAPAASISVMHPHRPIILPPGWKLLYTGDTAAAAYIITMQMVVIVHPLAEPPLL